MGNNKKVSNKSYAIEHLTSYLNLDSKAIISLSQVHSHNIITVTADNYKVVQQAQADALTTSAINKCLVIFTADCTPIIVYDRKLHIIAMIHAGWKGTSLKITQQSIATMIKEFGCNPQDIILGLGPCIDQCCYEVNSSV